jgi:hypothetical protein
MCSKSSKHSINMSFCQYSGFQADGWMAFLPGSVARDLCLKEVGGMTSDAPAGFAF